MFLTVVGRRKYRDLNKSVIKPGMGTADESFGSKSGCVVMLAFGTEVSYEYASEPNGRR